jgi:hypothetical protein
VGFRHLSNGTTGLSGYRTDNYLYLPIGATARTAMASHRVLSFTLEYDRLIHGCRRLATRNWAAAIPATPTAPAFTIDSFSDIAFAQERIAARQCNIR